MDASLGAFDFLTKVLQPHLPLSWEELIFLTTKQGPTTEVTHPRPPPSHRSTTAQDNPTYRRGLATIFWGLISVSTMEATRPTISTSVQDNTCFTSRGGPRATMLPGLLLLCARSVTSAFLLCLLSVILSAVALRARSSRSASCLFSAMA